MKKYFLLGLALAISVFVASYQKVSAMVSGGPVSITLNPQTATIAPNTNRTITASINTANVAVTGYQVTLTYSYTGSPVFTVAGAQVSNLNSTLSDCLTNSITHNAANRRYTISVSCVSPVTGPALNTGTSSSPIFSFVIRGANVGSGTLTFDSANSIVARASDSVDVLGSLTNGTYFVVVPPTATSTVAPSPTTPAGQPSATPVPPTATATVTPVPGGDAPNARCQATCGSNANCAWPLVCYIPDPTRRPYDGFCRNVLCVSDNTCGCVQPTPTGTVIYIYVSPTPPDKGFSDYDYPTPTSEFAPEETPAYEALPTLPPEITPTAAPKFNWGKVLGLVSPLTWAILGGLLLIIILVIAVILASREEEKPQQPRA